MGNGVRLQIWISQIIIIYFEKCRIWCFYRLFIVSRQLYMDVSQKKNCRLFKKSLYTIFHVRRRPCLFLLAHNFRLLEVSALWVVQPYLHYECIIKKGKQKIRAALCFINHWNNRVACICFNLIVDFHFLPHQHKTNVCHCWRPVCRSLFYSLCSSNRFMLAHILLSPKGNRAKLIIGNE